MSEIAIELDDVARKSKELYKLFRKLDVMKHELSSVGSRIDAGIASRRSIDWRLRDNRAKLRMLEIRLSELEQFMRESMEKYRETDSEARDGNRWIQV
ncbi:hypothetical protein [Cohnella sp. GCM10027633]|uniref:hypothetical protein n=1 Tax=unclassified Cohnella TaxID=2636738 RepID=UPI0036353184